MKQVYQVNDFLGNKLGVLKVPDFLDIIEVKHRVKLHFGDSADIENIVFLGNI